MKISPIKITFEKKSGLKPSAYVVFASEGGKLTTPAQALDKKTAGAIKQLQLRAIQSLRAQMEGGRG